MNHNSKVFVTDNVGLPSGELLNLEGRAKEVIGRVEERLSLPDQAAIDWVLLVERAGARYRLVASAEWYSTARPRTGAGKAGGCLFGFREGCDAACLCNQDIELPMSVFSAPELVVSLVESDLEALVMKVVERLSPS